MSTDSANRSIVSVGNDPLPKVSVVVPFYNQYGFIEESVSSIFDQGYDNLEVILVNDGSEGSGLDELRRRFSSLRYFEQVNSGPSAARNLGIQKATGDLIAFLDADDVWPRGKLMRQVAPMVALSEVEMVLGAVQKLVRSGKGEEGFELEENLFHTIQLGSLVVRRRVFDTVGVFDESLFYSEDQDWFLRVREKGTNIVKVDFECLYYRSHEASLTKRKDREKDFGLLKILQRSLKRRRESGSAASLLSLSELAVWSGEI